MATGSSDEEGCLFFADGRLIAVMVLLSDHSHGALRGSWFLEAGFGHWYSGHHETFPDLDVAETWLAQRLEAS